MFAALGAQNRDYLATNLQNLIPGYHSLAAEKHHESANALRARRVRSFVRRDSRLTKAQAQALDSYLSQYRFDPASTTGAHFSSLNLEIGAGDGECTLALARNFPRELFVAAEVYRVGLGRVLHAVNAENLANVRVAEIDVIELLPTLAEKSFDRIMVFFPDPWPKKRHHKRRLIQAGFLSEIARILKPSGRLYIATDIEDYAQHALEQIDAHPDWQNLAGVGNWAIRPQFRILTKFESKGLNAGRSIFDIVAGRAC